MTVVLKSRDRFADRTNGYSLIYDYLFRSMCVFYVQILGSSKLNSVFCVVLLLLHFDTVSSQYIKMRSNLRFYFLSIVWIFNVYCVRWPLQAHYRNSRLLLNMLWNYVSKSVVLILVLLNLAFNIWPKWSPILFVGGTKACNESQFVCAMKYCESE